jgi:hypothetical protein
MNTITQWSLKLALPLIVGFITPFVVDYLKKANAWLDNANAAVKQTAAIVVAGVATTLGTVLEMGLPTDLTLWDETMVKTVVAGLLAIAIKQHKQLTKK